MRDQGKESVDDTVSSDEEERKEIVRVHFCNRRASICKHQLF